MSGQHRNRERPVSLRGTCPHDRVRDPARLRLAKRRDAGLRGAGRRLARPRGTVAPIRAAGSPYRQSAVAAVPLELAPPRGSLGTPLGDEERSARCPDNGPALATRLPPHGDPVNAVLVREQLAAVCTALPTLSVNERTAMAGALNGKPQRQIATEMGCTVKAVSQSLRRARAKLARLGEW